MSVMCDCLKGLVLNWDSNVPSDRIRHMAGKSVACFGSCVRAGTVREGRVREVIVGEGTVRERTS